MASSIGAVAAVGAIGAYLDAKYHIASDINSMLAARRKNRIVDGLMKQYHDNFSPYHGLHVQVGKNDDLLAMDFEGRTWTYGELRIEIERLERYFRSIGVGVNDVVSVMFNNSPEMVIIPFALWKIGAIFAPINTSLSGKFKIYLSSFLF